MGLMRGIRKNVKGIYWVVTIVIVVTFVFWGTRMTATGGRKHVGTVFGKKVSRKDFGRQWIAAQRAATQIEFRTGRAFTLEQVEQMAWQRIVELREADRYGITVPMSRVRELIRLRFSIEGRYDENLYQEYLYNRRLTEEEYAAEIQDDLKIMDLEQLVATTVVPTPQEVRERCNYEKEQRKVEFHMVESDSLLPAFEVSGEGEQYYRAHVNEFREPAKVAVQYVMVKTDPLLETVELSEEELKEYYENNKSSYTGADGNAPPFEEVKTQIERILKNKKADELARKKAEATLGVSDGAVLKAIAQQNGLDFGETGLFSKDGTFQDEILKQAAFREAAFAAPLGQVSPIIEMNRGYCVLSPVRLVPGYIPPFEEVRKEAAEKERAQKLAGIARRAGITEARIDEFVKEYSVTPPDADVSYDDAFRYYESHKAEFRKPKKVKVEYVMVEKAPFEEKVKVTQKEIKEEYAQSEWRYQDENGKVKPLDEVTEEIEKILKEREADTKARERAEEIFIFSRPQRLKEQALKNDLPVRESRLFASDEVIDDYMGTSPAFASYALQTELGEVSPIRRTEKGYCVISPIQVVEESIADFEEVAEEAAEKAKKDKADALAGRVARDLYRQVSQQMGGDQKDFETACKELNLTVEESGYFLRDGNSIEKIGQTLRYNEAMFRDQLGKLRYPRKVPRGYFLYAVSEIKLPSDEDFAKDRDKYYDDLVNEKGQEVSREWLTALMREASVRSFFRPPQKKAANPAK
jgi:hypothetical protein